MKLTDHRFLVLDVLAMLTLMAGLAALWVLAGKACALWTAGALLANHVIGAGVCPLADDDDGSLLKWADEAPSMVLQAGITQAWPVILWLNDRRVRPVK